VSLPTASALATRFDPGDRVRARVMNPPGHNRLPTYARGRRGVVEEVHGVFALPDEVVRGVARPRHEPVYAVSFESRELWGVDGSERSAVSLDLWESYLEAEPAPTDPVRSSPGGR